MRTTLTTLILILFIVFISFYSRSTFLKNEHKPSTTYQRPPQPVNKDTELTGKELAQEHCTVCHIFPEPELVNQRSWNYILTHMSMNYGIVDTSYLDDATELEQTAIQDRLTMYRKLNMVPDEPTLETESYEKIRAFYLTHAPVDTLPQQPKPTLVENTTWFRKINHYFNIKPTINTMVKIDEKRQEIRVSNMANSRLSILDHNLDFVSNSTIIPGTGVIDTIESEGNPNNSRFLILGDLSGAFPEHRKGAIFNVKRQGNYYKPQKPILTGLYRPCSMDFGDVNNDGVEEVLVCNFGIEKGSVSIYEPSPDSDDGSFENKPIQTLIYDSGALDCEFHDFNNDGLLDIVALTSDELENLSIFINKGDYQFERNVIIQEHSAYGFVSFKLLDFNQDGYTDIITVNGDNGDNDPYNTLKNYHGIRIYLGDGTLDFKESYFYPMYGAYGVEIQDFDLDGDNDLAAIAFHPDFNAKKREQFVILKQTAPMEFEAHTHPSTYNSRWIVMDSGDLDNDGDADIVLAAAHIATGLMYDNEALMYDIAQGGQSLIFLENQTIR